MGEIWARPRVVVGALMLVLLGGGSAHTGNLASMARPAPGEATDATTDSRVLAARATARTAATPTTPRWAGSVDVSNKSAVHAAYLKGFAPG